MSSAHQEGNFDDDTSTIVPDDGSISGETIGSSLENHLASLRAACRDITGVEAVDCLLDIHQGLPEVESALRYLRTRGSGAALSIAPYVLATGRPLTSDDCEFSFEADFDGHQELKMHLGSNPLKALHSSTDRFGGEEDSPEFKLLKASRKINGSDALDPKGQHELYNYLALEILRHRQENPDFLREDVQLVFDPQLKVEEVSVTGSRKGYELGYTFRFPIEICSSSSDGQASTRTFKADLSARSRQDYGRSPTSPEPCQNLAAFAFKYCVKEGLKKQSENGEFWWQLPAAVEGSTLSPNLRAEVTHRLKEYYSAMPSDLWVFSEDASRFRPEFHPDLWHNTQYGYDLNVGVNVGESLLNYPEDRSGRVLAIWERPMTASQWKAYEQTGKDGYFDDAAECP